MSFVPALPSKIAWTLDEFAFVSGVSKRQRAAWVSAATNAAIPSSTARRGTSSPSAALIDEPGKPGFTI
jgi:hypothetical protein